MNNILKQEQIIFENQCIIDEGKVFYHNSNVYRLIDNNELKSLYVNLINNSNFIQLKKLGLVDTKISNIKIEGYPNALVVEHEKLNYFLHPSEFTNKMFYEAALCFIRLAKELLNYGCSFQDAHPFNITFKNGSFKYFDFTSIRKGEYITKTWLNEFYIYFAAPIFLASKRNTYSFASIYRKEHRQGIGIKLANKGYIKKLFFRKFWNAQKFLNSPMSLLNKIEIWIKSHPPVDQKGYWDNYEQAHFNSMGFSIDTATLKQKFVYDILSRERKNSLIDLACNKGYYSSMAEYLGYEVMALDYEEYSINYAIEDNQGKNISFASLDFTYPTPSYGWGNIGLNSFERFRSEIGLALGLIHHICLRQRFPVKLFCETCMNYSTNGIILEFVYPEDVHIKDWGIQIPIDYNLNDISYYFHKKFPNKVMSDLMEIDGIKRQFIYFYS